MNAFRWDGACAVDVEQMSGHEPKQALCHLAPARVLDTKEENYGIPGNRNDSSEYGQAPPNWNANTFQTFGELTERSAG
jgi:hypothetical protein